jgi:alginate O-acetyltransferase complex protein AlgI
MLNQFDEPGSGRLTSISWAAGATLFAIGLAKKVLLADPLGSYADLLFNAEKVGTGSSFLTAWSPALSYTFQLSIFRATRT